MSESQRFENQQAELDRVDSIRTSQNDISASMDTVRANRMAHYSDSGDDMNTSFASNKRRLKKSEIKT